ncbi:MAG: DNA primase [Patescibacteria group bacterium]
MDQVAQIREKLDIVAFIGEYVKVQRAGKNFRALCPFHNEKSPSFMISPERQAWHCFGCKKGGDIYSFIMEYERMEFPEALRTLAKRAGIELVSSYQQSGLNSQKERIYQANSFAKEYYHYVLTKLPAGKTALAYLKDRGLTDQIIETFHLGFSPASGTALFAYLTKKKQYTPAELIEAGLAGQNSRGYFDFFRGRVMFPLIDHRDNVVGFSGRVLDPDAKVSKYVNTRETLAYHKGEHFYGLSVAKDAIRREEQIIIVEGEFDVISCFQHGISNVVGVKGTALTEAQVHLLARYAKKLTFCFDGDSAGQEAIKRSLIVVEKKDLTPTVIAIPGGKDPDESLQKEPGLFKKAVREDIGVYDYLFDQTVASVNRETPEGKQQIAAALLPIFAQIKNAIIKEHYLKKVSSVLETSYESVEKELARLIQKQPIVNEKKQTTTKRSQEEILEEYLLALIIQSPHPKKSVEQAIALLSEVLPKERAYQKLFFHLLEHTTQAEHFDGEKFGASLPKELSTSFDTISLVPIPAFTDEDKFIAEIASVSRKLKHFYVQQKMRQLTTLIREREAVDDTEAIARLQEEYSSLLHALSDK